MPSRRLAITAALIVAFGIHSASALEIDNSTGNKASANFSDPDYTIPFPHVADDGSPPSANFQMQPVGQSGVSFGLTSGNARPDAFSRAQERMQQ